MVVVPLLVYFAMVGGRTFWNTSPFEAKGFLARVLLISFPASLVLPWFSLLLKWRRLTLVAAIRSVINVLGWFLVIGFFAPSGAD